MVNLNMENEASEKSFSPKDEIKFLVFKTTRSKKMVKKGFTKKDIFIFLRL